MTHAFQTKFCFQINVKNFPYSITAFYTRKNVVCQVTHNYSETSILSNLVTNCLLFNYTEFSNMFCAPASCKFQHTSPNPPPWIQEKCQEQLRNWIQIVQYLVIIWMLAKWQRLSLNPVWLNVKSMVDEVIMQQVSPATFTSPLLHIHVTVPPDVGKGPDQAPHIHILGLFKFGVSPLPQPLNAHGVQTLCIKF
jgi:hypothetical protein